MIFIDFGKGKNGISCVSARGRELLFYREGHFQLAKFEGGGVRGLLLYVPLCKFPPLDVIN